MMFNSSKIIALLLAFTLGFSFGAGIFVALPAAIAATYSVRDFENSNLIHVPDEKFIGPNREVDILDLNAIEFYQECQKLNSFGEDLNINLLQSRYDLIFHEKLDRLLSDKAREMPLKQLLSMEGVHLVLETVYIGYIETYECYSADGTPGADPEEEGSYWVNPNTGKKISGLEQIIADYTLDDFVSGNINPDTLLHNVVLADVLGYTFNEELGYWIDSDGNRVTGVMSVFADCTIDDVHLKINAALIGDLVGYVKGEDGLWYETDDEGNLKPVHSFMNAVADRSINTIGTLFEDITIGDIVPADQRTGMLTIIPAGTKIDGISAAINDSVRLTPLQFFINQGLIDFDDVDEMLDMRSDPEFNGGKNYIIVFKHVNEGEEGYDSFVKNKEYYESIWVQNADGNYEVPAWRTKLLTESFAYIIQMLTSNPEEEPTTPRI